MKNSVFCLLLVLLIVLSSVVQAQTKSNLQVLYQTKQFFDLRDEVNKKRSGKSLDILFYQGAVANKFNQIETSIAQLLNFLKKSKDALRRREALELLADNYVKTYQYAQAADTYKILLKKHGSDIDTDKWRDTNNSYRLFDAARRIPPQTISFSKNTVVQGTRDQAGLLNIPVKINAENADFVFDTGANISTVTATMARKLNLKIIDARVSVGTSTGAKVESKLGVAKTLAIGDVVLRNVIFLVMPDQVLYFSPIKYQINGIVGFPVIEALRKISINRKDEISIPANTGRETSRLANLCLDELLPLVSVNINDQRLTFSLDSGATTTTLYPPFFKYYDVKIKKLEPQTAKIGGAGGVKEILVYRLPSLNLVIAGKVAKLSDLELLTQPINDQSRYFAGNLGQDVIKQFEKLTLDFQSMELKFE